MRTGGAGTAGGAGGAALALGAAVIFVGEVFALFRREAVARVDEALAAGFLRTARTIALVGANDGTDAAAASRGASGGVSACFLATVGLAASRDCGLTAALEESLALRPICAGLVSGAAGVTGSGAGSGLGAIGAGLVLRVAWAERLGRRVTARWLGAAGFAVGRAGLGDAADACRIDEAAAPVLVTPFLVSFGGGVAAGFALITAGLSGRTVEAAAWAVRGFFTLATTATGAGTTPVFFCAAGAATFGAAARGAGLGTARVACAVGRSPALPGIGLPAELRARVVLRLEAGVLFVCGFMAPLGWGGWHPRRGQQ